MQRLAHFMAALSIGCSSPAAALACASSFPPMCRPPTKMLGTVRCPVTSRSAAWIAGPSSSSSSAMEVTCCAPSSSKSALLGLGLGLGIGLGLGLGLGSGSG